MLITPPETVAPQKRANGLSYLHGLPLNQKYAPLFRKTALIKASGLSENEI